MVAYWLWTSQILSSHFALNSWAWLFIRYLIKPFFFILICHYLFLIVLIFLGWQFWNAFLREQIKCTHALKKKNFNIRLQFDSTLFQTSFLLKPRKQKYIQFFIFLILYLHCWYNNTIVYFYNFIFSALNKTANTTKSNCAVNITKKAIFLLIKIGFTNVTQNWFHECYSKLVSWVLLKIDPEVLLEIEPQTLLKTDSTNVTQHLFYRCYSQ